MQKRSTSLASAVLMAAALGLPQLGQQVALQLRNNKPGEQLRVHVPMRRPKRGITPRALRTPGYKPTPEDMAAMEAADLRNARRALRPQGVCA